MSQEGFLTTLDVAMLFFRVCRMFKITGEKERIILMRKIVAKKKAVYLRDPKAFVQGKKVIDLRRKQE